MKPYIEALSKGLADQGKIIEAGWMGLRLMSVPEGASQTQIDTMRSCFFAGAQHLFASIMQILEPGEEPTDKDMERLDLIHKELNDFIEQFKLKSFNAEGSA